MHFSIQFFSWRVEVQTQNLGAPKLGFRLTQEKEVK